MTKWIASLILSTKRWDPDSIFFMNVGMDVQYGVTGVVERQKCRTDGYLTASMQISALERLIKQSVNEAAYSPDLAYSQWLIHFWQVSLPRSAWRNRPAILLLKFLKLAEEMAGYISHKPSEWCAGIGIYSRNKSVPAEPSFMICWSRQYVLAFTISFFFFFSKIWRNCRSSKSYSHCLKQFIVSPRTVAEAPVTI